MENETNEIFMRNLKEYHRNLQIKIDNIYRKQFELEKLIWDIHSEIKSPYFNNCLDMLEIKDGRNE